MLQYSDLELLYLNRNTPGRFRLVDYVTKTFRTSGAEGGGFILMDLSAPSPGFCRKWVALIVAISTAVVTDRILFRWTSAPDPTDLQSIDMMSITPNSAQQIPLIGGGTFQSAAGIVQSVNDVLVTDQDILRVLCVVTALSAQTAVLRGRYIDFPC